MSSPSSSRSAVASVRELAGSTSANFAAARLLADVLRVSGVGSLGWAVAGGQWVNAALFLLVLGGLMLPRMVATRPTLDVLYGTTLLFAAWSAVENLYVTYDWLDVVVHTIACGLIAAVSHRFLVMWSILPRLGTVPFAEPVSA